MSSSETTFKIPIIFRNNLSKGICLSLLIFAILSGLTWIASALDIDLRVGAFFFSAKTGWMYKDTQPWRALYQYGTIPGLALTLSALFFFFLGFIKSRWQRYQKQMLVIILTTVLGAGVLVNGILKPYCGRPRPREVTNFNGQWEFGPPCFDNAPGKGLSFPCGHCTMAFLFVTLIYFRRQSPVVAYGGAVIGIFYGILMGIARAAQGAHFVTDTLWALGVLTIVSLMLYYVLIPILERSWLRTRHYTRKQIVAAGTAIALIMAIITVGFLSRRPYYEKTVQSLALPASVRNVMVRSDVTLVKSTIDYMAKPAAVALLGQGFGWPNAREQVTLVANVKNDTLHLDIQTVQKGYFAELKHQLFITLPTTFKNHVDIEIRDKKK